MTDKYFLPLFLAGTLLLIIIVFFIFSYILIYSRRQQKNRMERDRLTHDYEKSVFAARLEEQERAMLQISKEIHDNVAQKVDFIQMNLRGIDEAGGAELRSKREANSLAMLEEVTADLRNISYSLNSDYIKARGLGDVLERELAYIRDSKGISCDLHIDGMYKTLPADTELLLYRIAQEALHNAVKYSAATEINIDLRYATKGFSMTVADNGVGFDTNRSDFTDGLGFRNMKQRAELLSAMLLVDAVPGAGCVVAVEMESVLA